MALHERIGLMIRIILPLDEAIRVLCANIDMGNVVKSIEATTDGLKVVISFPPLLRETGILVSFVKFESPTAYFSLEGAPALPLIAAALRLPKGISLSGAMLKIEPDELIRTHLNLKGLKVCNILWEGGAYVINAMPTPDGMHNLPKNI
jgi:hypothetical protein